MFYDLCNIWQGSTAPSREQIVMAVRLGIDCCAQSYESASASERDR